MKNKIKILAASLAAVGGATAIGIPSVMATTENNNTVVHGSESISESVGTKHQHFEPVIDIHKLIDDEIINEDTAKQMLDFIHQKLDENRPEGAPSREDDGHPAPSELDDENLPERPADDSEAPDGERPEPPEFDGERPELPEHEDGEKPEFKDGERTELPDFNNNESTDSTSHKHSMPGHGPELDKDTLLTEMVEANIITSEQAEAIRSV